MPWLRRNKDIFILVALALLIGSCELRWRALGSQFARDCPCNFTHEDRRMLDLEIGYVKDTPVFWVWFWSDGKECFRKPAPPPIPEDMAGHKRAALIAMVAYAVCVLSILAVIHGRKIAREKMPEVQETKGVSKSKTILGLIITAIFALGGQLSDSLGGTSALGQYVDASLVTEFKAVIQAVGTAAGLITAFYGRIKARAKVVFGG